MRQDEPFGSLDGGAEHSGSFVRFTDPYLWGDLALAANDRRARVLVGRRGSGKSRYLREMERSASSEGLEVFFQRDTRISLDNLRWMDRNFPDRSENYEAWDQLWTCAIYGGLVQFLGLLDSTHPVRQRLSDQEKNLLDADVKRQLPPIIGHMPIVAILNWIIDRYGDRSRLHDYLKDPIWFAIEAIVLKIASREKPIFAFLDTLDDNYEDAPKESTDAQLSLVMWILRKSVDPNIQNRMHVVITVRDTIYSALLDTEHGQRYNDHEHIRCLDWNRSSSHYYLRHKLGKLRPEFRMGARVGLDPFVSWVGFNSFNNPHRGDVEDDLGNYILRHTRFLPREINEIGNAISKEISALKARRLEPTPHEVTKAVSFAAKSIAAGMVRGVVNHMVALDGTTFASPSGERDFAELIKAELDRLLIFIGTERFDNDVVRIAADAFKKNTGWEPNIARHALTVFDVLWQHGLVGQRRERDETHAVTYFNTASGIHGVALALLPQAFEYVIHSCLLERHREITVDHERVETDADQK